MLRLRPSPCARSSRRREEDEEVEDYVTALFQVSREEDRGTMKKEARTKQ